MAGAVLGWLRGSHPPDLIARRRRVHDQASFCVALIDRLNTER